MKAIIEIELSGDFGENLSEDEVEHLLDLVIKEGSESYCMTGRYILKEIIEN